MTVRKILPWLAGALKTANLELRKVESDLAAPDSAPNWMCKDDYNKNATAAATASARMMLINIILTVPVLAIRFTDCITPCLQALSTRRLSIPCVWFARVEASEKSAASTI